MTDPAPHWVSIASFLNEDEARLLAGRLEAEGIEARVYPDWVGDYYGPATAAIARQGVDVIVPEDRADEARIVVEQLTDE